MTSEQVKLLKHPRMQDVAFELLELDDTGFPDHVKLQVSWWNIGRCHAPYPMAVWQEFQVPPAWVDELERYQYTARNANL